MRIIDLIRITIYGLNSPGKFKYKNHLFVRKRRNYFDERGNDFRRYIKDDFSNIYDEIEIIGGKDEN